MTRRLRWLLAGLLYSLADLVGPPVPDDDEREARIQASVMDAIAADHGAGMARKQLAARRIAAMLATGERADRGSTTADHYSVKRRAND